MKYIRNNSKIYFIKKKILLLFLLLFSLETFYESINYKMNLIIPISSIDFEKVKVNYKFYKKYIFGINNLVFIGNEEVGKLINEYHSIFEKAKFINEKSLIDVDRIKKLIEKRNQKAIKRSGWYIQQFLKMQYCKLCKDKYYLIWDCDTIPIKTVSMFNNDRKPYFDVKEEYHKPYFITMEKLLPELGKKFNYSFISEHMLIRTKIMKNLINRIENNINIYGDKWYEKIINSINTDDLPNSGFSEFETYGTFANVHYNDSYKIRKWKSLRGGKYYYNPKFFSFEDGQNISDKFDAISFENW